jgi:protease I
MRNLSGKRILIVATTGFEQAELETPRDRLRAAGATVDIASLKPGEIRGWDKDDWGRPVPVDKTVDAVRADDYDAIVLPGGVMNPDKLRINRKAVEFVRAFVDAGKPIAAICHGPWTLIEAGGVAGRKMTSYPSLQNDLRNAGANWIDQEVVVYNGLVTSRNVPDIPAFNRKMIEEIGEGTHERITAGN